MRKAVGMSDNLRMERFLWFHDRVKRGAYPDRTDLMERFEISRSTAQRIVTFLRDRLRAPLEYDRKRGGYRYADDSFELPRVPIAQEELLALLLARHLLERSAGGTIAERIRRFGEKLVLDATGANPNGDRVAEGFSAAWPGYAPVPGPVFDAATDAILNRRLLDMTYRSPASGRETRRIVEPHHLKYVMGSWFLLAWCRMRGDWRLFALSRIRDPSVGAETFPNRPRAEWAHRVNDAFGLFQGKRLETAVLRFTPFRARWVREQVWHDRQTAEELPDGGLLLSFPVADYREVKMMILGFGPDVEVLAPAGLREAVIADIAAMRGGYGEAGGG